MAPVASGSISLKNQPGLMIPVTLENGDGTQTVEARFIASDTVFGLFRASDGAPIAVGGVGADGKGFFAASQLKDALAAGDVVFGLKAMEDAAFRHLLLSPAVDGAEYGGFGISMPKNAGSPQVRLVARDASDLVLHGNVDVSIGAGRCLSLSSTDALSIEGMGVAVDISTYIHNAGAMTITGHVLPAITNTYALGSKSRNLRWTRLYCVQSPDVSSDARLKKDIEDLDGSLIYKLRPRKFRMRDGDGKLRFGLIAQEVKQALDELGIEGADLYGDENPDSLSLVYEELIAPLIAAVQEQKARNDALEARLDALESIIKRGEDKG